MDEENEVESNESQANDSNRYQKYYDKARGRQSNLERKANQRKENKENKAAKMEKKASARENKAKKQSQKSLQQNSSGKNVRAGINKKRSEKNKKKAEKLKKKAEKLKKQAKKAEKFSKFAAKIGKIVAEIGWIIILIVIIIGLLVFVLTGFGYIIDGLKKIATAFLTELKNINDGAENRVNDQAVIDALSYIEEMGYDLYGYGFTRKDNALEDTEEGKKLTYASDKGLLSVDVTDSDTEGVYDYITAYLVSDNYAYIIRNDNKNIKKAFSDPNTFLGGLTSSTAWGTGLISLYHQGDGEEKNGVEEITGIRGDGFGCDGLQSTVAEVHGATTAIGVGVAAGVATGVTVGGTAGAALGTLIPIPVVGTVVGYAVGVVVGAVIGGVTAYVVDNIVVQIDKLVMEYEDESSSIKVDREKNTLEIKGSGLFNTTVLSYDLEGWTGRYSMPLEFLLATHIATMAPDLSYKLATSFPTDVEILLYQSKNANIEAGIQLGDSTDNIITKDEFDEMNKGLASWFGGLLSNIWDGGADALKEASLSRKEAMQIFAYAKMKGIPLESVKEEGTYQCKGPEADIYEVYGDDKKSLSMFRGTAEDYNDDDKSYDDKKNDESYAWDSDNKSNTNVSNYDKNKDGKISTDEYRNFITNRLIAYITDENSSFATEMNDDIDDEQAFKKAYEIMYSLSTEEKEQLKESAKNAVASMPIGEDPEDPFHIDGSAGYDDYSLVIRSNVKVEIDGKEEEADLCAGFGVDNDFADEVYVGIYWYFSENDKYKDKTCSEVVTYEEKDGTITKITGSYKKACDNCYKYLSDMYKGMGDIAAADFETWVPYINCVTNHWYRNVYFTANSIKQYATDTEQNFDDIKIVDTDVEYEKQTGERWTLYETYSGNSGTIASSDYKLYLYVKNSDGQYDETSFYKSGGNYVLCKKVESGEKGTYRLSDDNVTYVKSSNGDYKLVLDKDGYPDCSEDLDKFRVGKKPKYKTDISENWTAYDKTPEGNQTAWKEVNIEQSTNLKKLVEETENVTPVYRDTILKVEQVEDGVRGETNSTIKKLFLDDYYLYDGSKSRAALIEEAKNMVKNKIVEMLSLEQYKVDFGEIKGNEKDDESSYDLKKKYNGKEDEYYKGLINKQGKALADDPDTFRTLISEGYLKDKIEAKHEETVTKQDENGNEVTETITNTYTATIDEISGPISLTKNALTAFSILENMHTLDAEYIYHDFKELVVELNYFDKEDLVEPEDTVMMFPISGISAAGWPDAEYDKSEEFYGTLIHSAEDYVAKRAETAAKLAEWLSNEVEENDEEIEKTLSEQIDSSLDETQLVEEIEEDASSINGNDSLMVQAAKDMMTYMQQNNYEYSQDKRASSFEFSQTEGHGYVDCSGFISWCLQEVGIFDIDEMTWSGGIATLSKIAEYYHEDGITDYEVDLVPGDIVVYDGHLSLYAGVQNGGPIFYDAGSTNCIMQSPRDISSWHHESEAKGYIHIPNELLQYNGINGSPIGSSESEVEFDGYQGGETVVAPVTGEVIKYGVTTRTNLEKDNDSSEKVGYIKIRVSNMGIGGTENLKDLDTCDKKAKEAYQKDLNAKEWLENTYMTDEKERTKLGYQYFSREYSDAGITGNILYLEGFDVSEILGDASSNNEENINKLKTYIENASNLYTTEYKVPNLLDDDKEFQLEVAEAAKDSASFLYVGDDGKLYIKEGAVIGYTYTPEKATELGLTQEKTIKAQESVTENGQNTSTTQSAKVGNYLRMILRNTDDEVIENVEEYVEKGSMGGIDTDFPEEFLFWEGVYVEGGISIEGDCYTASTGEENGMNDGKTTTAFGLTEDCQGTAEELGYPNYKTCLVNDKKVPIQMAQDIFIGEMEADREAVLSKVAENKLTENALDALVSIYHNSPTRSINLINILNNKSGALTVDDFVSQWGSNTSCEASLKRRRRGEYRLYSEGLYPDVYAQSDDVKFMEFKTDTPWAEFCENNYTKEETNGVIFEWK